MVNFKENIKKEVSVRIKELEMLQNEDGTWNFCFEGGLMTDAFLIILLRSLQINDEESLILRLANRIMHLQNSSGVWASHPDEKTGHLSTTIQAYTALLCSNYYTREHPKLKQAELFIRQNGGLFKAHFMTKWMLAVNGLYHWPPLFYIPMSFLLIPSTWPINIYQFSGYARIHLIPMSVAANKKFSLQNSNLPDLSHLISNRSHNNWNLDCNTRSNHLFFEEMKRLTNLPHYFHRKGYEQAEQYMLKRIEDDGTLYSYASATFFMIYALIALGYNKKSPIIQKAINGLKQLISTNCNGIHLENSTSTIWDTALISYALQEAGVPTHNKMIKKSTSYLLLKQHRKLGDWKVHNPSIAPGGWGFSHNNTINPDNDDTSAALRAITRRALIENKASISWFKGATYLLSMQNRDGGFGAFEKNANSMLLSYIPLENAPDAAIDPSTPDLTGRVLEFFGNFANLTTQHPTVKAAVDWLISNQQANGSWYGRWGVCYIYGTWAAITGLIAVGYPSISPQIVKAIKWLESIQHGDGGWGESCKSSEKKTFIPLPYSTPSQTAWALDAIIQAGGQKRKSVERGISYLLSNEKTKEEMSYPTGIGLPGQFYIHYHSYNKIFPLLALAHYLQKQ